VAPAPATLAIVASITDAGWARAAPNVVHSCALGEVTADGGRGDRRRWEGSGRARGRTAVSCAAAR
jgi:hypothetical protein